MIRRSKCWLLVPLIFGVVLSACSTIQYNAFPGSERPDAEVAVVEGSFSIFPFLILIGAGTNEGFNRIDGENIRSNRTVRLLPGRHRLEFWHVTSLYALLNTATIMEAYCLLEQDFLAGHRYEIQAHTLEDRSAESTTDKIYPATIDLKVSSPNTTDRMVTTPVICKKVPYYLGSFCKTDKECGPMTVVKGFYIFTNYTTVPGRCASQVGYEYGFCEAARP